MSADVSRAARSGAGADVPHDHAAFPVNGEIRDIVDHSGELIRADSNRVATGESHGMSDGRSSQAARCITLMPQLPSLYSTRID
jgi:hypothetical protein